MKKFSFLFMFLLLAQFVIAGNQKIVVRLTDKGTKHKTEVKVDKDGEGETIIVNPDDATITITITGSFFISITSDYSAVSSYEDIIT